MTHHDQRIAPWQGVLVLWVAAGLLLGRAALAQVAPPAPLVPLQTFSITGNASGSETAQTSTADYTITFTLAPDHVLDPLSAALRLRLEPDALYPEPCGEVFIPSGCFFPDGKWGFAVSENCAVSVKAFKEELSYARDLTPLLESFSATLQQVKGEWQARLVTTFRRVVAYPDSRAITFAIGEHGLENVLSNRSDTKFRVGP
jgi:hypothetical protein